MGIQKLHEKRIKLLVKKQAQYVGGKDPDKIDPFANFERRAPQTGETPVEVCFGDLSKHIDCLGMMTRGEILVWQVLLEELCKDAHNYIDLIYGQLVDPSAWIEDTPKSFSKEMVGSEKYVVVTKDTEVPLPKIQNAPLEARKHAENDLKILVERCETEELHRCTEVPFSKEMEGSEKHTVTTKDTNVPPPAPPNRWVHQGEEVCFENEENGCS